MTYEKIVSFLNKEFGESNKRLQYYKAQIEQMSNEMVGDEQRVEDISKIARYVQELREELIQERANSIKTLNIPDSMPEKVAVHNPVPPKLPLLRSDTSDVKEKEFFEADSVESEALDANVFSKLR